LHPLSPFSPFPSYTSPKSLSSWSLIPHPTLSSLYRLIHLSTYCYLHSPLPFCSLFIPFLFSG
jgi:hypothetical protein